MAALAQVARITQGVPATSRSKPGTVEVAVVHARHVGDALAQPEPGFAAPTARLDRARLEPGDVLITARGAVIRARVAGPLLAGSAASSNLLVVRLGPQLLPEVLVAYMQTPRGIADVAERAVGSVMPALTPRALGTLDVPVPPLAVQRELVQYCLAADAAFEAGERSARLRRELFASVIHATFSGADLNALVQVASW